MDHVIRHGCKQFKRRSGGDGIHVDEHGHHVGFFEPHAEEHGFGCFVHHRLQETERGSFVIAAFNFTVQEIAEARVMNARRRSGLN